MIRDFKRQDVLNLVRDWQQPSSAEYYDMLQADFETFHN